ncbi:hypothetical protein GCM10009555_064140 [Acrocarpospora macrocephala]|uniref:Uncharacterized protein n=1 Tax=Acrocarpospora macrocephala TaxID=150177 RepID=A0A5M3WKC6_9ACTN|nr:hypothetical protein [Acrocarpospora macrocephala]GES07651.1 hypothetical protein Amac_012460 [Acrocarpospora macrocephala]
MDIFTLIVLGAVFLAGAALGIFLLLFVGIRLGDRPSRTPQSSALGAVTRRAVGLYQRNPIPTTNDPDSTMRGGEV